MHLRPAVKVWPLVARRVSGGTNAGGLTNSPCAHTQGYEEEFMTASNHSSPGAARGGAAHHRPARPRAEADDTRRA